MPGLRDAGRALGAAPAGAAAVLPVLSTHVAAAVVLAQPAQPLGARVAVRSSRGASSRAPYPLHPARILLLNRFRG